MTCKDSQSDLIVLKLYFLVLWSFQGPKSIDTFFFGQSYDIMAFPSVHSMSGPGYRVSNLFFCPQFFKTCKHFGFLKVLQGQFFQIWLSLNFGTSNFFKIFLNTFFAQSLFQEFLRRIFLPQKISVTMKKVSS